MNPLSIDEINKLQSENQNFKKRLENIENIAKSFCVIECGFEWKNDCKIEHCEWQQIINECRGKNDDKI